MSEVELTDVSEDVDVDIVLNDFTANENFDISSAGGETTTILAGGTTDLSAGTLGTTDAIELQDGADLTLSATQAAAFANPSTGDLTGAITLAAGATATLNINGMTTEKLDLDGLVAANPGLSMGTVTLVDENPGATADAPYTVDGDTKFGGADIVTEEDGDEDGESIISMTVNQYETTSGSVSGDLQVNFTNWTDEDDDLVLTGVTTPTGTIAFDPTEDDHRSGAGCRPQRLRHPARQWPDDPLRDRGTGGDVGDREDIDGFGTSIISAIGWLFDTRDRRIRSTPAGMTRTSRRSTSPRICWSRSTASTRKACGPSCPVRSRSRRSMTACPTS